MVSTDEQEFWMRFRQGLLVVLGAVEDYLHVERTKEPRHRQSCLPCKHDSH